MEPLEPINYRRWTVRIVGAVIVALLLIYLAVYAAQDAQFKAKCPIYRVHCIVELNDPFTNGGDK